MDRPAVLTDAEEIGRRLGNAGRTALLDLARAAVECSARGTPLDPALVAAAPQTVLYGAFVSLHRGGDLRGCIGLVGRVGPAAPLVADAAESATVRDPRFSRVTPAELAALHVEVSLLTPLEWLEPAALPDAVVVGRHGLVVEDPPRRGLLLPQVATELGWEPAQFLDETCRKAGLAAGAWRRGARVARFGALVFGEPRG